MIADPEHVDVRAALKRGIAELRDANVPSYTLATEMLLLHVLGRDRAWLYAHSEETVPGLDAHRFLSLILRRASGEPTQYIIGKQEFWGLEFEVTPDVLIPRPETETLVSAALEALTAHPAANVIDLGTGSGAIALAIAVNAPHARVTATDISVQALEIAKQNARRLGVDGRVDFRRADCWDILDAGGALERYDLIVANPPYIREDEINSLAPEVRDFEPRIALAGGVDGLDFYRRIAAGAAEHLAAEGVAIIEVGAGQANDVAAIFSTEGFHDIAIVDDLAGIPRVVKTRQT